MRRLPEALENLLQASKLYEKVSYLKGEAFTLYSTGRVYEEQGNSALAMEYFLKSIEIAGKIGQKKLLGDLYYHCAKVSKTAQDWYGAFEYYEKSVQLSQEISREDIKQRAVLQQISYDAEIKQHEIDSLKIQAERSDLEARNRENLLMASFVSLIFFGALALYLRQQLSIKHKKEQELVAVTNRLEAAREQLNHLVETDYLTDVANRRSFDREYQEEYRKASSAGEALSVIMVDIDLFKQYNDLYGHQQGDDCLKLVARSLQAVVGGSECQLARYGGEEFVIVAKMNGAQSRELAEQARQFIEQLNCVHSGSPYKRITCSFGVAAMYAVHESSPEGLLRSADQALYQAKLHGRNRVCFLP
jgi:diguanylate cyclase (GGDEF)-like protein